MKNEQQSRNLLLKVNPGSTLSNNFLQPATNVFVAGFVAGFVALVLLLVLVASLRVANLTKDVYSLVKRPVGGTPI